MRIIEKNQLFRLYSKCGIILLDTIKVMIVDDSASVRMVLKQILNSDPSIEVIATASNPLIAERYMNKDWPDVIVLDIEMPHKDGITYLKEIMAKRPTPVVICSSLTHKNASITIEAMRAGAVEVLAKPKIGVQDYFNETSMMMIDAVKSASQANLKNFKKNIKTPGIESKSDTRNRFSSTTIQPKHNADVILSPSQGKPLSIETDKFIAIGASAGGTQAIESVLETLPASVPGIVIVQHMPEKFTEAFAQRLNNICSINVKEAVNNDKIEPGMALVAPGNKHMLVKRNGSSYSVEIKEGPPVSRHRPAVDVLFRSVAKFAGKNALGIILTGMGDDGAAGMTEMHQAGARTIAQNEDTCIVFGMPKEAIARGAVDVVLPLNKIAGEIIDYGKGV